MALFLVASSVENCLHQISSIRRPSSQEVHSLSRGQRVAQMFRNILMRHGAFKPICDAYQTATICLKSLCHPPPHFRWGPGCPPEAEKTWKMMEKWWELSCCVTHRSSAKLLRPSLCTTRWPQQRDHMRRQNKKKTGKNGKTITDFTTDFTGLPLTSISVMSKT